MGILKILFAIIAIAGYIANIKDKKELSYYLWTLSNGFWCMYNYSIGEYQMSAMFLIYLAFCLMGLNGRIFK